jgi:hypothetical protein
VMSSVNSPVPVIVNPASAICCLIRPANPARTACSAFKMRTVEMHTVKLRCSDGWMRFAVATRNSEVRDDPEALYIRNRYCSSFNSARWSECLIANHSGHVANLPGDGSHSCVADWLDPEIFTVDSPRVDKWAEINLFRFVFTIAPEALCTGAWSLAASRHGEWKLVLLQICSGPGMDRTGREHPWSREYDHCINENYADSSWNLHGFHVVTMSSPGESFNASWFIYQNFFPSGWSPRKTLMVHVDNAPAHKSRMTWNFFEHNPLKRLPHPSYLLDISPSYFYCFWESKASACRIRDSWWNEPSWRSVWTFEWDFDRQVATRLSQLDRTH